MPERDQINSSQNLDRRRKRVSWQTDLVTHTPPPSTPCPLSRVDITAQHSASAAALERAFSSQEEQPSLFPPHFYRDPTRSRSRSQQPSLNSESSVDSTASDDSSMSSSPLPSSPMRGDRTAGSRYSSSPVSASPEQPRSSSDRDRYYSPMVDGFARLGSPNLRGRPSSWRGDLQAKRMFEGA